MTEWNKVALKLSASGMNAHEISDYLNEAGYPELTYSGVRSFLYRYKKRIKEGAAAPKNNLGIPEEDIEKYEVTPKQITVVQNTEPVVHGSNWDESVKTITFGVVGDTHIGSKYAQLTYLHDFYDLLEARGITSVYHTGDVSDGIKMRPGHEYELCDISYDEMVTDIIANYPKRDNITTYFITGNHDASVYKHIGADIGVSIADKRKDMVYLGRDAAVVFLTPKCSMELRHPWDGTAYAISYKTQKLIEAMEADSKPNILCIGHYHKAEYIFYRNVHCLQTACFQSQTPFTRGKGMAVHTGGWIVTVNVAEDGSVISILPEFVPFYKCIKDDYKNFR